MWVNRKTIFKINLFKRDFESKNKNNVVWILQIIQRNNITYRKHIEKYNTQRNIRNIQRNKYREITYREIKCMAKIAQRPGGEKCKYIIAWS